MRDPDDGLRAIIRAHLRQFHWTSIETGGTGLGIADSNYLAPARLACAVCSGTGKEIVSTNVGFDELTTERSCECARAPGLEGWVECKATDGWSVSLTEHQSGWLFRRARLGGRAWIAVRRRHGGGPRRGPAVDELWMVPAALAREARREGLRSVMALDGTWRTCGGPARWDWPGVAARLLALPPRAATGALADRAEDLQGARAAPRRSKVARRHPARP